MTSILPCSAATSNGVDPSSARRFTIYVDDDFDFSSEFEPAAKALDELEVDFFDAFQAPICSSGGYTCALLDDKSLKCWGGNYNGQLGLGDTNNRGDASGEMGDNLPVVDLGSNYLHTYFNDEGES